MKKLTQKTGAKNVQPKAKSDVAPKRASKNAQCCAKTSRTAVGCHD